MNPIWAIVIILLLFGGLGYGWHVAGYYGGPWIGGGGLILLILVLVLLLGL